MLKELYCNEIRDHLIKKFSYTNIMKVPKISKISINVGLGIAEKGIIDSVVKDIALITAQKPIIVRARKSVSNFKLREGMPVGVKVTLRRTLMYCFLERLLYIALPRSRDFKGLRKTSFDGNGNFSFGIKEHIIFPEVDYDSGKIYGMDLTIETTATTNEESLELLSKIGFPFVN
ncbi:50S ribosomal subunit protein L5 [Candidatus Xenohaliotis californiensis]|uniref:Large ribosomal subunit protein uL5 n=1 Tax=Candidatus Xenohaliotis californiensis TaxID=84677 RepID=A0ABP0EUI0_9RICK|nr:50S ribosomal subunit protein L5 [Candidatus Xenohaliotis californiensis]